jgi:hypothetical protein
MKMTPLTMAVLLAATTAAAFADDVSGDYCLEHSVQNGHGVPRTNMFRRGSDCPEEDQVTIYIEDNTFFINGAGLNLIFSGLPPREPKETPK